MSKQKKNLNEEDIVVDRDSLPEEMRDWPIEKLLPGKEDIVTCKLFTGQTDQILLAREKLLELREVCSGDEEAQQNLDLAIQLLFEALAEPDQLLEAANALDGLFYLNDMAWLAKIFPRLEEVYQLLSPLLYLVLQDRINNHLEVDPGPSGGRA